MRWKQLLLQRRTVTSFTSIFNKTNGSFSIPKPFDKSSGLFGHDLLKDPSGFYLFKERSTSDSETLVHEALHPDRKRKMVQIFDNLSNCLCRVADLAEFVRMAHPSARFSLAAEEASMAISSEVERLNTHLRLYQALKKVTEKGDIVPTTELDDYVASLFISDFEQSGIHLDEEKRKLVVQLNEFILHTGSYFTSNTGSKRVIPKSRLTPEIVRSFKSTGFKSTGDEVEVTNLFADSDNEVLREAAFKAYFHPDDHQENLLKELLVARKNLATLCGFSSFAERSIRGSIMKDPKEVSSFLSLVSEGIKKPAQDDFDEMLKLKQGKNPYEKCIKSWDVPYYTAMYKEKRYQQNIISCLPFFSLGSCIDGLSFIIQNLFSVSFSVAQPDSGEIWNSDVIKLNVLDDHGQVLGVIYCDLYERKGKPHQDCHYTIQGGCTLPDGSYQLPIVVVMSNLSRPSYGSPTLLTPYQVDNLFHEMGHAIHSMIARTPYQHITGTRCSTDLAEIPSILMEYFSSDPRVVQSFAKHYKSNEPIPVELLSSWLESKKVFNASDTQLQTFYAVLDQTYHGTDPFLGFEDTTQVLQHVQNKYYGLPYVPSTAWQLRFGHLVGYGAKYYSYLVSRACAHSIWYKLFAKDPLCRSAGEHYKETLLSVGAGKPPRLIVESVLDEKISPEFLASCLLKDVSFGK